MTKFFFRLQDAGINITDMQSHTSSPDDTDDVFEIEFRESHNDSDYDYDYDAYENACDAYIAEKRAELAGTICACDDPWDGNFGGANGLDDDTAEVVVLTGRIATDIYDGVRLYSSTISEIARFSYREWQQLVADGDPRLQEWDTYLL